MSLLESLLSPGTTARLGWTLVHFVWQAAVVATLLAVLLRLLGKTRAAVRYLIACSALALMVVMPVVTMQLIEVAESAAEPGPPPAIVSAEMAPVETPIQIVEGLPELSGSPAPLETADLTAPITWRERFVSTLEPALPYLVLGWLVGVFGLSAWHLGGWAQLHRLKRRMVHPVGAALQRRLAELSDCLSVRRAVTLLESALVEVPTVVGWLRPVILLPASALTGLSPEQLEAILAHELAHVRRYDYLVNILQTLVEILGFYHPAVWWVSHRIRVERENCCDDIAVQACGDSVRYARALTSLEESRHSRAELAVAATGGSLIDRIARLLGRPADDDRRYAWLPGLIALLLVAAVVIPTALALARSAPRVPQSPIDDTAVLADQTQDTKSAQTQIAIQFVLADVFCDAVLDPETAGKATGLLERIPTDNSGATAARPTIAELQRPLGEVFPRFTPAPGRGNELIDLLGMKGYAAGKLTTPKVTVSTGEPASFAMGQPPAPNVPEPRGSEFGSVRYTVVATEIQDPNTIMMAIDCHRTYPTYKPGDPNKATAEWTVSSTVMTHTQDAWIADNPLKRVDKDGRECLQLLLVHANVVDEPAPTGNGGMGGMSSSYGGMMGGYSDSMMGGMGGTTGTSYGTGGMRLMAPAGQSAPSTDGTPQVLLGMMIAEANDAARLDFETAVHVENILGRPIRSPGWRVEPGERLNLTVGEVLRQHVVGQGLSQESVRALTDLLSSKGYMKVLSKPQVIRLDNQESQIAVVTDEYVQAVDDSSEPARVESVQAGVKVSLTPHVGAQDNVTVEMKAEATDFSQPRRSDGPPIVHRRTIATTFTTSNGQGFMLPLTEGPNAAAETDDGKSLYIVTTPYVIPPLPSHATQETTADSGHPQALLEVRTVVLQKDDSRWQAVSAPKVLVQPGRETQIMAFGPEHFPLNSEGTEEAAPASIRQQCGAILTLTPQRIDGEAITFDIVAEIAYLVKPPEGGDGPVLNRRTATGSCTVRFGGTVAAIGLTDNPGGREDELPREIAVFVTAHPAPDPNAPQAPEPATSSLSRTGQRGRMGRGGRRTPGAYVAPSAVQDTNDQILSKFIVAKVSPGRQLDAQTRASLDQIMKGPWDSKENASVADALALESEKIPADQFSAIVGLLDSAGYVEILSRPMILTRAGEPAQVHIGGDPNAAAPGDTVVNLNLGLVAQKAQDKQIRFNVDVDLRLTKVLPPPPGETVNPQAPVTSVRSATSATAITVPEDRYVIVSFAGLSEGLPTDPNREAFWLMMTATAINRPDAPGFGTTLPETPTPLITATFSDTDLRDVLAELSRRSGMSITADATVKPQTVTADLAGVSVEEALRRVLKGTGYAFKRMDGPPNTRREQARITMTFQGDALRAVLADLATAASVPILADESVTGEVYAQMENVSLDTALEMVLAGTSYIVKKTPEYYLVATYANPAGSQGRRVFEAQVAPSAPPASTYLVYRPISMVFYGENRRQALMDVAATAEVSIALDKNIAGEVTAEMNDVPVETAFRILLADTAHAAEWKADHYEIVEKRTPDGLLPGAGEEEALPMDRSDSRAWTIMRQLNCPPLLLGLTQQLAKVLAPARRDDRAWRDASNGGTLRLRVEVEGDLPGEVVVGLFEDARWLAEPVAVRRLPGAGTFTLRGLPAGDYQIGAMIGEAPVPLALGVHRTWPQGVEIRQGQTATADVLVSEAFQQHAAGSEECAKDYLGLWDNLDESSLLQGQLTGPDGRPVRFGTVQIREYNPGARGIAAPDVGTNEQGVYKFDAIAWPYRVNAMRQEFTPSVFGVGRQWIFVGRVLEGPQRVDLRFEPFPEGTAKIDGRVVDQKGRPVKGFFLRVTMPPWSDIDLSQQTDGDKTQVNYDVPFISEQGRFELDGLPAGRATVHPIPFEIQRYDSRSASEDVTLEAGKTTGVDFELVGKAVFYGRVVFEDGTPAVITPAPWRGGVTRILMPLGGRARGIGEVGPDGYFTIYLNDSETESLALGNSRLVINVPTDQDRRSKTAGDFPYEKLSDDKSRAGTVTVKRPESTPVLPPRLRRGGPLPAGWRLDYAEWTGSLRRAAGVSVRTKWDTSDSQANATSGEEQFELYGPDGKLAENFKPESAFILNTAQQYILVSRQDGAAADAWQIRRGPFTLDLTCPGQYTLTIPASPTAASETRNVELNFTKPEETRNLLPTALQQYVGIPPAASADANSRTLTITAPPAIGDGIVAELKTTDVRPRRVALDFSIIQAEPQTLADLGIEWTSDGNHPSSASTGDIRIGRIDNRMSSDSWRAKLKLLEEDSRLDILAKPQVAGQDGKTLSLKVQSRSHSEWFPSGETSREIALWITPSIGDYNDVTLRIAVDVNDSYEPRNRDQSSSRISQDTSYAVMVIRDGDTAVLTGLKAESYAMKPRSVAWLDQLPIIGAVFGNNPPTQETAFFVTLHLLPDAASIDD